MDAGMMLFKKVKPDQDFISEILEYDVKKLESTSSITLSKYATALAQYLIYFKSKTNETKVEIHRKQRILDGAVNQLLNSTILKEYKNRTNAYEYIVSNTQELSAIRNKINNFKDELLLLDGVDKTISELVATLKREMTRRENELYQTRKERYS